jgi:hypothetical protein
MKTRPFVLSDLLRELSLVRSVSPDRELILPPVKDSDSFSVQLETVHLNGVCTKNMMENLTGVALKLSEEAGHLH